MSKIYQVNHNGNGKYHLIDPNTFEPLCTTSSQIDFTCSFVVEVHSEDEIVEHIEDLGITNYSEDIYSYCKQCIKKAIQK